MYSRWIFLITFCLIMVDLKAQESISLIRAHYKQVTEQISNCSNGDEESCSLYSNTLTLNSGDLPWRGVGDFSKEVTFWYDDRPRNCDDCGVKGINVLKMITSRQRSAASIYYEEWLFDDGVLVFYYLKTSGEEADEYRYYYNEEVLIKYVKNNLETEDEKAATGEMKSIKIKAKNLQQSFLLSFE